MITTFRCDDQCAAAAHHRRPNDDHHRSRVPSRKRGARPREPMLRAHSGWNAALRVSARGPRRTAQHLSWLLCDRRRTTCRGASTTDRAERQYAIENGDYDRSEEGRRAMSYIAGTQSVRPLLAFLTDLRASSATDAARSVGSKLPPAWFMDGKPVPGADAPRWRRRMQARGPLQRNARRPSDDEANPHFDRQTPMGSAAGSARTPKTTATATRVG